MQWKLSLFFAVALGVFVAPSAAQASASALADSLDLNTRLELGSELLDAEGSASLGRYTLRVDAGETQDAWSGAGARRLRRAEPLIAFLFGFVGFGLGHMIANDGGGQTFWLTVDIAMLIVYVIADVLLFNSFFYIRGLGGLVWTLLHLYQGYDAYMVAGGRALAGTQTWAPQADRLAWEPARVAPTASVMRWAF